MKVLYLITKANWGGAQRYVFDMALHARAAGYEVAVAYGGDGEMAKRLRTAGMRCISIPALARDPTTADFAAYKNICTVIRAERPDILHLNSSKAGALGAFAGRRCGVKKIIFTDHGWAFEEKRGVVARAAIFFISWLTALCSHVIIAVSDYELRITQRMPFIGKKVVRIYNGVDVRLPLGSGESIRRAFPSGATITGTVGELNKNKNQIALIEQAKNNPDMYVAIVGDGEERTNLEKKIREYHLENRVKLFGFIPASDVLKGFDVFALTSMKEALGYVILEARVAGLPIIANRVGGVGEALDKDLSEFSLERMVQKTLALYEL